MDGTGIVAAIKTALEDYASFDSEEVSDGVFAALDTLDTDLTEAGYTQSSKADNATAALENAMNDADQQHEDEEEEEKAEKEG